ncbi:MAG: LytTR family DNA-binding domain-containing protein, partial [Bacteroidota bacterium]
MKAFQTHPASYLIKSPSLIEQGFQLDAAIQLALINHKIKTSTDNSRTSIVVENKFYDIWISGVFQRLKIDDILYLEADNMKTFIYCVHKVLVVGKPLGRILEELIHPNIIRCHKTFAFNKSLVSGYEGDFTEVHLDTSKVEDKKSVGSSVRVGKAFRDEVKVALGRP